MASKKPSSPSPHPANLSLIQMQEALPRLKRRLTELERFDGAVTVEATSTAASILEKKYDDALIEVFGNETVEYQRYRSYGFYEPSEMSLNMNGYHRDFASEIQAYKRGVSTAARNLQIIIDLFEEK